jgi:hypothetical protein
MIEAKWLLLSGAWVSTVIGLAWLALAMDVHWRQVFKKTKPSPFTRVALRCMGTLGLLVSLGLCLLADHPTMAALVWIMFLAGSAALVAMVLAKAS